MNLLLPNPSPNLPAKNSASFPLVKTACAFVPIMHNLTFAK